MNFLGLFGTYQALVLLYLILWIWVLVDIIKSEFKGNGKLIWILVVLFTNVFGLVLYFLIGRQQKVKRDL